MLICISSLIVIYHWLYRGRTLLPLQLIMQYAGNMPNNKLCMYKPHNHFLVTKSTLLQLLIEVNSDFTTIDWPKDHLQMLLLGASIVYFTNKFLKPFQEDKKFVLIAIFIWQNGKVIQHTLFQCTNVLLVCYTFYTSKLVGWTVIGLL